MRKRVNIVIFMTDEMDAYQFSGSGFQDTEGKVVQLDKLTVTELVLKILSNISYI